MNQRFGGVVLAFSVALIAASCFAQAQTPVTKQRSAPAQTGLDEEQANPNRIQPLEASGKVVLQDAAGSLYGKAHCDSEGNFYLRGLKSNSQEDLSTPISKYAANGELKANLAVPTIPDRKVILGQLTIDSDDNTYVAAHAVARGKRPVGYALKFDKDGKLKSTVKLEAAVYPYTVVGFKGGELLVTGLRIPDDEDASRNEPFTAIFGSDGRVLKRLDFGDDSYLKERADRDAAGSDSSVAIIWSSAVPSTDGNVYLMRATSPATIRVISPAGETVRTLTIDPQSPGLLGMWLQESEGSLAVVFGRVGTGAPQPSQVGVPDRIIKVVDRYTGESLATYDPGPLGSALGCFNPPLDFTFIGQEAGKMQLVHAVPK